MCKTRGSATGPLKQLTKELRRPVQRKTWTDGTENEGLTSETPESSTRHQESWRSDRPFLEFGESKSCRLIRRRAATLSSCFLLNLYLFVILMPALSALRCS